MRRLPDMFFKWSTQILYIAVCSVFFMLFILVYNPFGMDAILDMGRGLASMNLAICFSIVIVLLSGMRVAFHFMGKLKRFTWAHYVAWCMGEVLVISTFVALYIHLMRNVDSSFFSTLTEFVGYCYLIFIFPYLLLSMAFAVGHYRERAREAKAAPEPDDTLIRFYDEYQNAKLIISASAVMYITAEENYVNIFYLKDDNRVANYVLRASMRSLEQNAGKHGLVRCHRSYYVNPAHVKVLRKDAGGQFVAELDVDRQPAIPVSRTYYERLAKVL